MSLTALLLSLRSLDASVLGKLTSGLNSPVSPPEPLTGSLVA